MKVLKSIQFIFVALPLMFAASDVSAHATPISYTPESASILSDPPQTITIRFSERVDAPASNITVFGPSGNAVDNNQPVVDPADSRIYSIGVNALETGTYSVSWQVVSADDGHFTKGAYNFSVATVSSNNVPAEPSQVVFLSKTNEGLATGIELIGQGMLWGSLIILWFVRRKLRQTPKRLSHLVLIGSILIIIGTLGYLVIKSQDLGELRSLEFISAFKLFIATSAGRFALYRVISAFVLLIGFWIFRRKIFENLRFSAIEGILLLVLIILAGFRVASSHAAAAHFMPAFTIVDHTLHMIFKGLWLGIALSVSVLLLPVILKIKELNTSFPLLNKISKLLTVVFAIVGITGAYIVWLDLKDPANIQSTDWGMRFVGLTVFGGMLIIPRLFNQIYIEWNLIRAGENNDQGSLSKTLSYLKLSYPIEALLAVALLIATGFIMITTPPVWNKNVFYQSIESQGVKIELQEHPTESDFLRLNMDAENVKDLVVTLTNEEKNIGPIVVEVEKRTDNSWVLSKNQFSPTGHWKLDVTARKPDGYDATGTFALNYPDDIDAGQRDQDQRAFGLFEIIVIANAIGILFLAVALFLLSKYLGKRFELNIRPKHITINQEPDLDYRLIALGPALIMVISGVWFATPILAKSSFQRSCEKSGNFWHSMLPTRAGVPVAQTSTAGCMIGNGQYHISDQDEYEYFVRPVVVKTDLVTQPQQIVVGVPTVLSFSLKDNNGEPMRELTVEHERLIHAMIIGQDFTVFSHVHPDDTSPITNQMKQDAVFPVLYTFPKAGKYLIAVDFAVKGQHNSKQFPVEVSGNPQMAANPSVNLERRKTFDGYDVILSGLDGFTVSNDMLSLRYHIERAGKPVTDLQPYLGAAVHLAIVKADLSMFIHTHGEVHLLGSAPSPQASSMHYHPPVPASFGPNVEAHLIFPEKGTHVIFGEFKHGDNVILTNFMVETE